MSRGCYTRTVIAARNWRVGEFTQKGVFDSHDGNPEHLNSAGQGFHSLTIADVDGDGKDEISNAHIKLIKSTY